MNELARDDFVEATDLTIASLTAGVDGFGLGKLFENKKVKRMIASYVGENKVCVLGHVVCNWSFNHWPKWEGMDVICFSMVCMFSVVHLSLALSLLFI